MPTGIYDRIKFNSGEFKKGQTPWSKGKTKKDYPQLSNSGVKKGTISGFKGKYHSKIAKGKMSQRRAGMPRPDEKTGKEIVCQKCGIKFYRSGWSLRRSRNKYCSWNCYRQDLIEMTKSLWLKKLNRKTSLSLWKDSEYVRKQMKARHLKPNKPEIKLDTFLKQLLPREYKFVGDGQFIIAGKCPDFINVNGQKKIIELYGDYWHRNDNPQERIDLFAKYGYQTLIIWEKELKDNKELKSKILNFQTSGNRVTDYS